MSILSGNLIYLRDQLKLNQHRFGELFGLSRDNIASYERGTEPKIHTILKIVNYFHIDVVSLVNEDLRQHQIDFKNAGSDNVKKMVPNLVPNLVPNFEKSVYSEGNNLNDIKDSQDNQKDIEVQLLKKLLDERERLVFSLNETINSKDEAIKAQKTYIEALEQRLAQLEGDIKANREQIN